MDMVPLETVLGYLEGLVGVLNIQFIINHNESLYAS